MACDIQTADIIETLVERLQTATLLGDRRDACRTLLPLSMAHRVEVGAQAMEPMLSTIKNDIQETELVNYCLRSLNYIISGPNAESAAFDDELFGYQISNQSIVSSNRSLTTPPDPGLELAEIFLKKSENMAIILDVLVENDFETRRIALRLLRGLSRRKLGMVQDAILSFPLGISRLIDLISDEREVIRNEALLLFIELTKDNKAIQNLFAFEGGFDKIIYIIELEGFFEGGFVSRDCLNILLNSLQDNESNQTLFKEAGHIQRLMPFCNKVLSVQNSWTEDRTSSLVLALQIFDSMIVVTNSPMHVQSCQTIMQKCGLLDKLCELLATSTLPIGVLSETMNTAADIIRGQLNENATLVTQTNVMSPVLLLSMMKEMSHDQEKRIAYIDEYIQKLYRFLQDMSTWKNS